MNKLLKASVLSKYFLIPVVVLSLAVGVKSGVAAQIFERGPVIALAGDEKNNSDHKNYDKKDDKGAPVENSNKNKNENNNNIENNNNNTNKNTQNQENKQTVRVEGGNSSSTSTSTITINSTPAPTTTTTVQVLGVSTTATPVVVAQAAAPIKELPKTGLPLAGLFLPGLLPLGARLRKINKNNSAEETANSIWTERQFKA